MSIPFGVGWHKDCGSRNLEFFIEGPRVTQSLKSVSSTNKWRIFIPLTSQFQSSTEIIYPSKSFVNYKALCTWEVLLSLRLNVYGNSPASLSWPGPHSHSLASCCPPPIILLISGLLRASLIYIYSLKDCEIRKTSFTTEAAGSLSFPMGVMSDFSLHGWLKSHLSGDSLFNGRLGATKTQS